MQQCMYLYSHAFKAHTGAHLNKRHKDCLWKQYRLENGSLDFIGILHKQ